MGAVPSRLSPRPSPGFGRDDKGPELPCGQKEQITNAEIDSARLLEALEGLDLTSADGRAGINTLLSEIERACPACLRTSHQLRHHLGEGKEGDRWMGTGMAGSDRYLPE